MLVGVLFAVASNVCVHMLVIFINYAMLPYLARLASFATELRDGVFRHQVRYSPFPYLLRRHRCFGPGESLFEGEADVEARIPYDRLPLLAEARKLVRVDATPGAARFLLLGKGEGVGRRLASRPVKVLRQPARHHVARSRCRVRTVIPVRPL